jgi:hypothetical protein
MSLTSRRQSGISSSSNDLTNLWARFYAVKASAKSVDVRADPDWKQERGSPVATLDGQRAVAAVGVSTISTMSEANRPSWQVEHERQVAAFPAAVREAHTHSLRHRAEILASSVCGCFYCCSMFEPSSIRDWVDEDNNGEGQTALCPHCGIDSVIGDQSGSEISFEFLRTMKRYWF